MSGFPDIATLFRVTLRDPKEGAFAALSLPIPREAAMPIVLLVSILSTLLALIIQFVAPQQLPSGMEEIARPEPWLLAVRQFGQLMVLICAIYFGGRILDGRGGFKDVAVVLSWLQIYSIPFQLTVVLSAVFAPQLGAVLFMGVGAYLIYVMVGFIDIVHELGSMWKATKLLILVLVALALGFSLLLTLFAAGA